VARGAIAFAIRFACLKAAKAQSLGERGAALVIAPHLIYTSTTNKSGKMTVRW
jgi:hypothetical protein